MLNNWFIFILLPFLVFETLSLLIPCKRGIWLDRDVKDDNDRSLDNKDDCGGDDESCGWDSGDDNTSDCSLSTRGKKWSILGDSEKGNNNDEKEDLLECIIGNDGKKVELLFINGFGLILFFLFKLLWLLGLIGPAEALCGFIFCGYTLYVLKAGLNWSCELFLECFGWIYISFKSLLFKGGKTVFCL
jgi:hypothetical protein